jgi:hypothetical protein
MTDLLSQERKQTVDNFINARLRGSARITAFERLATYLDDERHRKNPKEFYSHDITDSDAETLFMRLIAIVRGAEPPAPDCTFEQAYDRLYTYINVLREDTETTEDIVGIPNSTKQLAATLSTLNQISNKMDKRDQDFLSMLTVIKEWMNKYGRVLDRINQDYEEARSRVKRLDRKP